MGVERLGAIDLDLLEKAVRLAIGDADSHCLNFVDTKDGPRQFLRPLPNFNIPHLDFSQEQSPQAAALTWMHTDVAKGFDLSCGPLFRYALPLIKVAEDRFFLYCLNHHLIIDMFGASLLVRRCGEVYSLARAATDLARQHLWSGFGAQIGIDAGDRPLVVHINQDWQSLRYPQVGGGFRSNSHRW
jgi:hypothetical protein